MINSVSRISKTIIILLVLSFLCHAVPAAAGEARTETEKWERYPNHKYWGLVMGMKAAFMAPGAFEKLLWEYDRVMPAVTIKAPDTPHQFGRMPIDLDMTYTYNGKSYTVDEFLKRTQTSGLLVLKGDDIVYERYLRGSDEDSLFTSYSAAKSLVSALVGIAIEDGLIESVDDPITDYVPELKGTGYDGVPIKHILQMGSGVKFGGSWGFVNPFSGLWGLHEKVMFFDEPLEDYMKKRKYEKPSGQEFDYQPIDTLALGMLLKRVTGKTASAYMEEKIWQPLGMEADAFWNTDAVGVELCYGYLNATLRDYAKFGRLFCQKGRWDGKLIVPESWVIESTTPEDAHLMPGRDADSGWGYQYQWWVPKDSDWEFMARGHFGQRIYVYPGKDVVIVKTGVDVRPHSGEEIALFRAIADYVQ